MGTTKQIPPPAKPQKQGVHAEVKTITPELAREYLGNQITNRKWKRDVIDRYKTAILSGSWFVNGETIIFDDQGRLVNGQHRLMAIIEADKPIDTLVATGVQSGLEVTIDMGKSRTLGDVFQMKGVRNAKLLSRTSKLLLIWEEKFDELVKKRTFTREILNVHPQKIYNYYIKHRLDIDRACGDFKKNSTIITNTGAAVLSFVFSVLEKIDLERCYAFITSFTSGNIKKDWTYMVRIRDEFMSRSPSSKVRLTEGERISFLFGLWNVIYHKTSVEEAEKTTLNIPVELLKPK